MLVYVCLAADGAQAVNDNYRDWTGNYEPSEGMGDQAVLTAHYSGILSLLSDV